MNKKYELTEQERDNITNDLTNLNLNIFGKTVGILNLTEELFDIADCLNDTYDGDLTFISDFKKAYRKKIHILTSYAVDVDVFTLEARRLISESKP